MHTDTYRHARLGAALLLLAALLPTLTQSAASLPAPAAPATQSARAAATYAHLPLAFEENRGQSDPATRFLAHGAHFSLALTPDALTLAPTAASAPLRFSFVDANPTPQITSSNPLPGIVNYFIGNDPTQWRTNIPTAGQVRYHNLYPGIDLAVYGRQGGEWEYDVVVAPGADPESFGVAISGADNVRLDGSILVMQTGQGEVRQRTPVLYQEVGGVRQPVTGGYTIRHDGSVGFVVGEYDRSVPLVIDPVTVSYSTYLGGNAYDDATGIAVDSAGNVYVTGDTTSTNFPTMNPIQPSTGRSGYADAFVTEINAAGTALVYSTYLGGSDNDHGNSIAVDGSGNAYITGQTQSRDFPTQNPIQPSYGGGFTDTFVTEINAGGSALIYSTYLGGSGGDVGYGIAVDVSGNAYITGQAQSTNFPTKNPIQPSNGGGSADAFVTEINAGGSLLVYSTYLGGNGYDYGSSITVDGSGNAYITGQTQSTNFPTKNPIQPSLGGGTFDADAFVTEINAAGTALVYGTYLGGSGSEFGLGIAVDSGGNAYITGETQSTNFPTQNPIQPSYGGGVDAFVTKINAGGSALVYSTYLGGSGGDVGYGIAVDVSGNAYVTGSTSSTNFPTKNPFQPSNGGGGDAFVTEINAGGSLLVYSTYLGGSGADYGYGIAVDSGGNAYITGDTRSTNLPIQNPIQPNYGGGIADAFVTKFGSVPAPPPTPTSLHVTGQTYNSVTWAWSESDFTAFIEASDGSTATPLAPGTTTFTKYGIPYGSYGCLTVAAYNAYGASVWSPWLCSLVVPLTPYNPHIAGATTSSVSFGWATYDTLSSIAVSNGTTVTLLAPNSQSYTATGIAAGYFTCIAVAAYNASFASPYSGWACGLAKPAMPTNVHVTGNGQGSVSFAWTNHDPYSGIALTNDGVHLLNEGINATSYTQSGMASGQYACIEIAAYNSSGASAYTSWVCGQAM